MRDLINISIDFDTCVKCIPIKKFKMNLKMKKFLLATLKVLLSET